MGVDTISLYNQLQAWAADNTNFLAYFAPGDKQTNYVRVITRIYATGKMSVSLMNASSRSGGLDVGVPKPVNIAGVTLPTNPTNTADATAQNYLNASNAPSQALQAIATAAEAAKGMLPGGSLRVVAASSRSVSMDETFKPPVVFGYLGFDCAITDNGQLGAPIPTYALLQKNYKLNQFKQFQGSFKDQTGYFNAVKEDYNNVSTEKKLAIRNRAKDLGLISGDVAENDFIRTLRQSVDATKPELTQKFQALADFSSHNQ